MRLQTRSISWPFSGQLMLRALGIANVFDVSKPN